MHVSRNRLTRKIYDIVVGPSVNKIKTGAYGTILNYDIPSQSACVRINLNGSTITYDNIKLQDGLNGIVQATPKPGDTAFVVFHNHIKPYITTIYPLDTTNSRKISYGPDIPGILGVI